MHILTHVELTRVFFIDIETVPGHASHDDLCAIKNPLWHKFCTKRHARELAEGQTHAALYANAGLYAEFGKIVCISVGFFRLLADDTLEFRTKSFADDDEHAVLRDFGHFLERLPVYSSDRHSKFKNASPDGHYLCAHNGREFDYGYLGRRMLICGQPIPPMLDVAGRKPWDIMHLLDTMELWKFGDNKGHISLALLAGLFGIPSPKDDIDGSQVGPTYWVENDLARIVTYCEKDIVTTARIFLHYQGKKDLWKVVNHVSTPWPAVAAGTLRLA